MSFEWLTIIRAIFLTYCISSTTLYAFYVREPPVPVLKYQLHENIYSIDPDQ